jgi:hypothetical protein
MNLDAVLLDDIQSGLPKLVSQGVLVDLLQEPRAQFSGYAVGTANDPGSKRVVVMHGNSDLKPERMQIGRKKFQPVMDRDKR